MGTLFEATTHMKAYVITKTHVEETDAIRFTEFGLNPLMNEPMVYLNLTSMRPSDQLLAQQQK